MSFNYLIQRQINAYNDIRCWVENNERVFNPNCVSKPIKDISFPKENSRTKQIETTLKETLKDYFFKIENKINERINNDQTWKQFVIGQWIDTNRTP